MDSTNAFTTRRKNEDLREKYQVILNELANSSRRKNVAYQEYLVRLNEILPRSEKTAVSAEILAAQLSDNQKEQKSIRQSIRSFASNAATERVSVQFVSFPDLYTTDVPITCHFAQLDEAGNITRRWDTVSTETRYYLKEEEG